MIWHGRTAHMHTQVGYDCVDEEARSGWLCPPLVSVCFLVLGNQVNIYGHLLACCICEPTVAPARLGDIWAIGISAYWPSLIYLPSVLSPKHLQDFLPLLSVLSRKRKDLRSLFLICTASGSLSNTDQRAAIECPPPCASHP